MLLRHLVLTELWRSYLEQRHFNLYLLSRFFSVENGEITCNLAQLLLKLSLLDYRVVKLPLQCPFFLILPQLVYSVLDFDLSLFFLRLHERILVYMGDLGHRSSHILASKYVYQDLVDFTSKLFFCRFLRADTST